MIIRLEVNGSFYDYDDDELSVRQALKVEEFTGLTMLDFGNALLAGRPDCLQALMWLIDGGDLGVPIGGTDPEIAELAAQLTGGS